MEAENVHVIIDNTGESWSFPFGTSLKEIAEQAGIKLKYPILGALYNNKVRELNYRIHKSSLVKFFDITSSYGQTMYVRSVYMLLYKAAIDLYPNAHLRILHSISGGKFCELDNLDCPMSKEVLNKIQKRMMELVKKDLPFIRKEYSTQEAIEMFRKNGLPEKCELLDKRSRVFTSVYQLDDTINYFYGHLVPSTGYLNLFALDTYETGFLLITPQSSHPDHLSSIKKNPKLFSVYQDYKKWANIIGVPYVYNVNQKVTENKVRDTILITESYQEKILANIADTIQSRQSKMVLICGPSSSGKTTTCKRLSVELGILGYDPVQISVDDFFVERVQTPKLPNGEYDFESIDAIDLPLFNDTLNRLINGEEVPLPTFDFINGKKIWKGNTIKLQENSIIVIEGIHCLNPRLTESVDDSIKFKMFVSALTSISIDSQNPIPTSDNRLLRRIIRDFNYRGYSAQQTISRWPSVRAGEMRNIFPYQENADVMFNTSLICELGVLKPYAVPLLVAVPETCEEHAEAYRLLKFLSYFKPIPENTIPGVSILREFVGGSNFSY